MWYCELNTKVWLYCDTCIVYYACRMSYYEGLIYPGYILWQMHWHLAGNLLYISFCDLRYISCWDKPGRWDGQASLLICRCLRRKPAFVPMVIKLTCLPLPPSASITVSRPGYDSDCAQAPIDLLHAEERASIWHMDRYTGTVWLWRLICQCAADSVLLVSVCWR